MLRPWFSFKERIESIKKAIDKWDKNPYIQKKQRERLAMLSGSVGMIKVGADSKVELKEKKDILTNNLR